MCGWEEEKLFNIFIIFHGNTFLLSASSRSWVKWVEIVCWQSLVEKRIQKNGKSELNFSFFSCVSVDGGESVKNEKIKNFHSNKFWEWRIIYSVWSQKKEFCSYRHFSCIAIHHILLRSLLVREVRGKIIAVWYFNVSTLPRSILTRCTNARQLKNIKRENRSEEVKMLCWNKGKFMEADIPIALKVRASSLQHCTLCHYMHINSYIGGANAKISEFLHFFWVKNAIFFLLHAQCHHCFHICTITIPLFMMMMMTMRCNAVWEEKSG